jgi:3-oxoacyl-[acyl-carrier-protein] synthase-3
MNLIAASQLIGFGHCVPSNRVDNAQMEQWLNLEAGWIERRTGIRSRCWVEEGESLIDLAEKAGANALERAGIARHEIALTILATSTPDHLLPPTAPLLTHRLGLMNSGAFDLSSACSGFLYALSVAEGFVRTQAKPVLVVAANILSRRINLKENNSAILFGDAAGAVVMMPSTDTSKGLFGVTLVSDGSKHDLISIAAGGSQQPFCPTIATEEYKMHLRDGQAIFTQAIEIMVRCANQALVTAGLSTTDIHRFVPHQANARIIENVAKKLGISAAKTVSIISEYGNSSAASIPLALSIANQSNSFTSGEKILLTAAGAGLTGGAMVLGM